MRLSLETLEAIRAVRTPTFAPARLGLGMVHLGAGAFHRAHQGVFTDDAIEASGGDWGVAAVSMRKPDVAGTLTPQDGLYTVETLDEQPRYRVIGSLRRALTLPLDPAAVVAVLAAPTTHVVTLTVTEKGYCLKGEALDFDHPDIVHDIGAPSSPRSAIGVLAAGLAARRSAGADPLTIVSCDNVGDNGARLRGAVLAFADRLDDDLARWIADGSAFPQTMVDSIVPAATRESLARAEAAVGLEDQASVQREPFAQWVIEDRFAGPRPAWDKVGVEIVPDVAPFRRIKLHVLNGAHSTLAYLGLARGHTYVREAIRDAELSAFVEALVQAEIAPALPDLPIEPYWARTRARFFNPMVDHRLDQIAQDGAFKLAERLHPLMIENARTGRGVGRMARVVRAWLDYTAAESGVPLDQRLADPHLFSDEFRRTPGLVDAVRRVA